MRGGAVVVNKFEFDIKRDCYSLEYMVRMAHLKLHHEGTVAAMERRARYVVGAYLNRVLIYGKD